MKAESAAGDETVHIDIAMHASLHTSSDLPQDMVDFLHLLPGTVHT